MSSTRQGWKGPYVAQQKWSTVKDIRQDAWGTKYIYIYPAKYNSDGFYDLYSCGKNLRDDLGQKDDVTSWKEEDEAFYSTDRGIFVEFLSKWLNFIIILLFLAIALITCSKSQKG